jgi:hypothetical protein
VPPNLAVNTEAHQRRFRALVVAGYLGSLAHARASRDSAIKPHAPSLERIFE